MSKPASRRARRGSDTPYGKGDRRESAILDHLEKLLETMPLAAISIDDIAKGAGISRSTLYFYFASRAEVFTALLRRTLTELNDPNRRTLSSADRPPAETATAILRHVLQSWREHGTVMRRAAETIDDPEIDQLWQESMSASIEMLAEWIERGRASGQAIDTGVEPAELAEALAWMVERGYYQLFRHGHSDADEERKVAAFTSILLRSAGFVAATPDP